MPQGIDEDYNGTPDMMEGAPPEEQGPDPAKLKALLMQLMQMLGLDSGAPAEAPAPEGPPPAEPFNPGAPTPDLGPEAGAGVEKVRQLEAMRAKMKGAPR